MVTVWWYMADIIHYSFLSEDETISEDDYCNEIEEMHQKLSSNQPAFINRKGSILLQDNTKIQAYCKDDATKIKGLVL